MASKKHYYIGVLTEQREVRLITDIDLLHKEWKYDVNSKPYEFNTKKYAEEMVDSLVINFIPAFLVQTTYEIVANFGYREDKPAWRK